MAELSGQYGNPVAQQTDEYGNPSHVTRPPHISSVGEGGSVGDTNVMSGPGTGVISGSEVSRLEETGELGPSGTTISSSSSSSEDDEHGGRRKKGLRQKIKEKLSGGHHAHFHDH